MCPVTCAAWHQERRIWVLLRLNLLTFVLGGFISRISTKYGWSCVHLGLQVRSGNCSHSPLRSPVRTRDGIYSIKLVCDAPSTLDDPRFLCRSGKFQPRPLQQRRHAPFIVMPTVGKWEWYWMILFLLAYKHSSHRSVTCHRSGTDQGGRKRKSAG